MRNTIKKLQAKTKKFLDKYNPLLEQDRIRLMKNYGELELAYLNADALINEILTKKIETPHKENRVDLIKLATIKETIGYLLSFIQVEYKAKVSLDIIKSLALWKNNDGGFFYSIPSHQYAILLQTLELASEIKPYDYVEKEDK